ncbi:MAG: efflux RND transporter permease subunit, partial [Ignavibacteriaceae bacterium]
MILTKFSLKRQITLLMIYCVIIGFSFFSFSQLKIDFFPDIQFPYAGIITSYTGVGPEDIENLITRPIEEAVSSVKNIEQVNSQSFQGASIVTLEFKYGTDMDQADVDIRKNIDFIRDYLPPDANEPLTFIFDPSLQPIIFMTLSSNYLGPAELRRLSEETIEPLLERVEGVASVQTQGGLQRQINVYLNPVLLASYNLSPTDINMAIQSGGGIQPGGTIETGVKSYNLRIFSEYNSIEQIKNTIVTMKGGQPVYVKDVAEVIDGYKESTSEVRADFGEGITIMISKQSDANTVITSRKVKEAFPYIQKRLPESFIIGISIPMAVITTFAVLFAADLTLNIISMAGLALAIGMLVDNSIVVLENIYRHRELGEGKIDSADKGASEVGMAITASTLTTISVFLPVLFVPNITGQLFKDMVLTITFSLVVSLLIALTLVPMISSHLLKISKNTDPDVNQKAGWFNNVKTKVGFLLDNLSENYSRFLHWALYHKKTVLISVFVLFVFSIFIATQLGGEFLPKTDQGFINIVIESPAGNPIEKTRKYAYELEDIFTNVIKKDEIESVSIFFGNREGLGAFGTTASTIEVFLKLTPKEQRKRTQFEIQDLLRKKLDNIAGITYFFQEGGSFTNEKDIEVKVIGFNVDGAKSIANQIKEKMEKIPGLVDIALNVKATTPELQIHLYKDVMNDLHLSTLQVAANISTAIQGQVVSQFREKEDEYDIRVQYAKEFRNQKDALSQMQIAIPAGQMVKLNDIAQIVEEESSPTIFRENQSRFISVGCGLSGIDLSTAVGKI